MEHETEIEEGSVPHRSGAGTTTPHNSEAIRKVIEMLMDYDMIEPSSSPGACGVVMTKKKGGQLKFCCDFRYLNAVTIKDAYPTPRIDESLSKLRDAKFFTTLDWGSAFWQVPLRKRIERRRMLRVNWDCSSEKERHLDYATQQICLNYWPR